MAVNTTPIFVKSAPPDPVNFQTEITTDLTGATGTFKTVITAGADGARVDAIDFMATGNVANTIIYIWHHDGASTRALAGYVRVIRPTSAPNNENPPWSGRWVNPRGGAGKVALGSGERYDVALYSNALNTTFTASVDGGSYTE